MTLQTVEIARLSNGDVVITVAYDDATWQIQGVRVVNNSDHEIEVTLPGRTVTFSAGTTVTRALPANAYTLDSGVDNLPRFAGHVLCRG